MTPPGTWSASSTGLLRSGWAPLSFFLSFSNAGRGERVQEEQSSSPYVLRFFAWPMPHTRPRHLAFAGLRCNTESTPLPHARCSRRGRAGRQEPETDGSRDLCCETDHLDEALHGLSSLISRFSSGTLQGLIQVREIPRCRRVLELLRERPDLPHREKMLWGAHWGPVRPSWT